MVDPGRGFGPVAGDGIGNNGRAVGFGRLIRLGILVRLRLPHRSCISSRTCPRLVPAGESATAAIGGYPVRATGWYAYPGWLIRRPVRCGMEEI